MATKEALQAMRVSRKASGLCVQCGSPKLHSVTMCLACVKAMRKRQKNARDTRQVAGCCIKCGKPREHYESACDACTLQVRLRQRKRLGCNQHVVGKRGRPPIVR